ncbi:MAG: SH3 domain-containing protein [Anaerolineales bacterium]
MSRKKIFAGISIVLLLPGCALKTGATPTPTETPSPTATVTPIPPTDTPSSIPTVTITPTQTAFAPFESEINTENVNLRSGPGYFFPVLRVIHVGDTVTILGKAPDKEWFRVRTADNAEGWVYHWLMLSDIDLQEAPVIEPQDVLLIRAHVRDLNGVPMEGIGFNIARTLSQTKTALNPVLTNADGDLYSYMPFSDTGTWIVAFSDLSCVSNVWTDINCTSYKPEYQGIVEPVSLPITLPSSVALEFTWK